jgi:succinoglycan biosynthesis transport protein ExoP
MNFLIGWRLVRKHWATALATALAISLAVTFYTLGQKKIYVAQATVQLDPSPPRPLGKDVQSVVDLGVGDRWGNREYCETQYRIMQSLRVAAAVVRELDLGHDSAFIRNASPGAAPPPGPPAAVDPEIAAEIVRGRLKVEPIKDSRLAVVKFEDADPVRAQRILRTLVEIYVEQNLDEALSSTSSAVEWLRGQLDNLKNELEGSEFSLHEYKLRNNILSVAFDDQSNMVREEVRQLNEALTATRIKRQEFLARRDELLKVDPDDPDKLPARELLQSGVLQGLRGHYEDARRRREELVSSGKGLQHPEVAAAESAMRTSREALLAEIHNIVGSVERDLSEINQEEQGLAALYANSQKRGLDLNLLEIEYNRLKRQKNNNEKLYELVLERTKETDLTRVLRVNNIRVLDPALLPRGPARPRVALQVMLGIIGGLFLGVTAAIGRALLDRTVKTPDDIERELGCTFLGLLPELEAGQRPAYYGSRRRRHRPPVVKPSIPELVVHQAPASGIAEAARAIRTNLIFMAPDNPYRVLLVTSPGPAEGKTTVACCIAIAMAQAGRRVALIDCDLRRPRLHRIFSVSANTGVSSALIGDIADAGGGQTEVPNLTVIPAGPLAPNPAELLDSAKFKAFLDYQRAHYDMVILDSPPVLPVTDATILTTLVDATVLVVRAFETKNDVARHGIRVLADVGRPIAGVVLNAVDLDKHEYKYYYYSYKRDGYYSSESRTESPANGSDEKVDPPSPGQMA